MARRGTTGLLAILVAVSSASWQLATSVQATGIPFPWGPAMVALLPEVAAVAAGLLVVRAAPWWRRAGLGYLGAFMALEALGVVQIVPLGSQFQVGFLWWSGTTSALALVVAVLIVVVLRDTSAEGDDAVPGPFRWAAVTAGLLLVGSSTVAWSVSANAPAGRLTFGLSHASSAVWIGTIAAMAVLVGITAVVATSAKRSLVVGASAGLLASHPLALGIFLDWTWHDAGVVLAAGWWLALAAQLLLVVALVGMLGRGADRGIDVATAPRRSPAGRWTTS